MHFDAVFNRQKTRIVTRSLGTRILRFNRQTNVTKTVKIIQKFTVRRKGAEGGGSTIARPPLPEYATGWHRGHLVGAPIRRP